MKNERIKYNFKGVYRNSKGISKIEVYKNFDKSLSEKDEKEELYKFNQTLKDWYEADTIITSSITKQGSENNDLQEIIPIDLNKLKSYNLDKSLTEQLIVVIDEITEFKTQTGFEEETDLINEDDMKENRVEIIKTGLKTIKEMYKLFVKLGFSNEEMNKWLDEIKEKEN